jgi:hypothetical protein
LSESKADFNKYYVFIKHDSERFTNPEKHDRISFELHSGYVFSSRLLSRFISNHTTTSQPAAL